MKRESRLEREYREMMTQAAPDLWERIESGLSGQTAVAAEETQERAAESGKILRMPGRRLYGAATAVAAMLIILIAVPRLWGMKAGSSTSEEAAAGGAENGWETMAETAAAMAEGIMDTVGNEVDGMAPVKVSPDSFVSEIEIEEGAAEVLQEAADTGGEIFSEERLGETQLLCLATVRQTFPAASESGGSGRAVYEVVVDEVCFLKSDADDGDTNAGMGTDNMFGMNGAEGTTGAAGPQNDQAEITGGSELMVVIAGAGADGSAAGPQELEAEERYLLPLKRQDGMWEPVFSGAPQIRVTGDGGYLFPAVYESLMDGASWNEEEQLYYRDDDSFLPELTALIEAYSDDR